jgi:hypothetical protein
MMGNTLRTTKKKPNLRPHSPPKEKKPKAFGVMPPHLIDSKKKKLPTCVLPFLA